MGEATPAQSAAGTFAPMLGVGMGGMSGGVGAGPGPPVRGPAGAPPPLHNAIVERLRARIELCRRHHSTCESRYQRGQAESSDREHENTLHLLNIVHQGPGTRKGKGSRAAGNQQPAEYGRANGEQKSSEGEHRLSTRIAVQGSLRRKIEGNASGQALKQNGLACGFAGSDFKRVRLDVGGLKHVTCSHSLAQPPAQPRPLAGGVARKSYMMPHGLGSDIFNMTLKEMKKEPVEIQSCSQSNSDMIFDFKDESGCQIDPELQDLFDELTKSVPPLNDLEFEKMLKQDDAFGLDLGRPSSAGAAAGLCSPMEKPIKTEHSPDFGQSHCGSPHLRPASAGPSFTLTTTASTNSSQKTSSQSGHPRAIPCWPEISHAQQLKQMAANQQHQQPAASLLHHHHQTSNVGLTGWTPAMSSSHSTTSTFSQGKASTSLPLGKEVSNCLYKSNGQHACSHQLDVKGPGSKPSLHFSPKTTHSSSQPVMSLMSNSVTKSEPLSPSPGQSQPHTGLHYQSQQIPGSGSLCLQQKPLTAGLQFRMAQQQQQQQAVPPGPRLPSSGGLGLMPGQSQPRPSAASANQQKGPAKLQPAPRHLSQQQQQQQHAEKDNACEQFSRHLTRPPPEYKQTRGVMGVQQGNLFAGQSSSQSPGSGLDPSLQPCQLQSASAPKVGPSPLDRRFCLGADCPPGPCIGQFQQNNLNRVRPNQSKPRFLGPNPTGKSFGMTSPAGVQNPRAAAAAAADLHTSVVPAPPLGGLMGWGSTNKQVPAGLGGRCLPAPQGVPDMPSLPYPQRHVGPPNQMAPDLGMLPLTPPVRDGGSRSNPALLSCPSPVGGLNQASPEQRVPAGSFVEPGPGPGPGSGSSGFQSGRSNRVTFDFLPEGDNTVPGINADSDFIDSLLKSGSGNDDWMKDINLDEILGSHS